MASIVSAGTTSATALNMSADTTGILQLASNNGTVALTISTSQNVGIGTSSPATPLDVTKAGGGNFVATFQNTTAATPYCVFIKDAASSSAGYPLLAITNSAGTSTYLRVDSSTGNTLVGADNFSVAKLNVFSSDVNKQIVFGNNVTYYGSVAHNAGTGMNEYRTEATGGHAFFKGTSSTADVTIDSSGRVLMGTTVALESASVLNVYGNAKFPIVTERETTALVSAIGFRNPNGFVGYVQTSGSSTLFTTSSDYRLKNTIAPITGALAKVALLKPVTYKWNVDGSDGQGFIAHELQEVVPDAVSGAKDGTEIQQYEISPAIPATFDEEGNELTPAVEAVMGEREVPAYQGIDTSFLVATLTAAIQELNAKVTALENK